MQDEQPHQEGMPLPPLKALAQEQGQPQQPLLERVLEQEPLLVKGWEQGVLLAQEQGPPLVTVQVQEVLLEQELGPPLVMVQE